MGSGSCDALAKERANITPQATFSPWEGGITTTSSTPSLYAFTKQSVVIFPVPPSPLTTTLLIEQTEQSSFDWSIAEVRFGR